MDLLRFVDKDQILRIGTSPHLQVPPRANPQLQLVELRPMSKGYGIREEALPSSSTK